MIRITIELLPYGLEKDKKIIGTGKIWNDMTGNRLRGNYKYEISGVKKVLMRGRIMDFPRRSRTVWDLLKLALDKG